MAKIRGLGLVIDCGTGSVRARLFCWVSGEWVGDAVEVPWETYLSSSGSGEVVMFGEAAGRTVQKALSMLWERNKEATADTRRPLRVIGIGGHMHAPFVIETDGRIVLPVQMWNSNAAARAAEALSATLGYKLDRRLTAAHIANLMAGGNPAFDPNWVKAITTCAGYIGRLLSGHHAVGPCEGSGLGFNDPATGQLSTKVLSAVAGEASKAKLVASWLPRILRAGEPLGTLSAAGKEWAKMPAHWSGALIAAPEGDQAMGRLALCRGPKDVSLVLGSSLVQITVAEQWGPRVDPTGTVDFFSDPCGLPMSMGLVTDGMRVGDGIVSEFAKAQFGGVIDKRTFVALEELARQSLPLKDGTFGVNMPFIDPALGVKTPFNSIPGSCSIGERWTLILLQVAASVAIRSEQLLGNRKPERIVLGGAAARDNLLATLIATATETRVFRPNGGAEAMFHGAKALARATEACGGNAERFQAVLPEYQPTQEGDEFQPDAALISAMRNHIVRVKAAIASA